MLIIYRLPIGLLQLSKVVDKKTISILMVLPDSQIMMNCLPLIKIG